MIQVARHFAKEAQDPHGTLVEKYLREHRGITAELPQSISFHPSVYVKKYNASFPAMMIKMHDEKSRVQAVHLTLLDERTAQKADVDNPKMKFGPTPENLSLNMTDNPIRKDITLIAEGLETALSLASTLPHLDVQSTLDKQNFKRIVGNKVTKHVVLCLDNDLKDWQTDKVITSAAERLVIAGKTVWVAEPACINGQKTDFNDTLNQSGINAIIQTIGNARSYQNETIKSLKDVIDISSIELRQLNEIDLKEIENKNYTLESQTTGKSLRSHCQELASVADKTIAELSDAALGQLMQTKHHALDATVNTTNEKKFAMDEHNHSLEQEQ